MKALSGDVRRTMRRGGWLCALASGALLTSGLALAHETETTKQAQLSAAEQMARASGGQLYASPAQVRLVQQKLKDKGHDPGRVDGVWGEETADEVRDFQRAQGLAQTGQFDTSLLSALDIGHVLEGATAGGAFSDGLLRDDKTTKLSDERASRGAPLFVSPAHVAQVQHLLREEGHYSGAIDGVWGDETARAANKYRQSQGLDAHDGVDIALLRSLNREAKAMPELMSKTSTLNSGLPLEAGPAAIRALQRQLAQAGHDAGDVDGQWGDNTRRALRDFQREHDLETTGSLTLPTLAALGVDVANKASNIASSVEREGERMKEEAQDAVAESEVDE